VDLRVTAATVEILYGGRRIASHARSSGMGPVIDPQHLEPAQRHFGLWDVNRELEWAATVGPSARTFLEQVIAAARVKEQAYRASLTLKKLDGEFGSKRLEAACARAIAINARSLSSVRSILRNGLDLQGEPGAAEYEAAFDHGNVRGPRYYH
jgi:hypothetical protein